jgi:hypothetical protein
VKFRAPDNSCPVVSREKASKRDTSPRERIGYGFDRAGHRWDGCSHPGMALMGRQDLP